MTRHIHIEARDEPICDFCSRSGVVWRYPCSAVFTTVSPVVVVESTDDWSACEACAAVVDLGDPDRLAAHVVSLGSPDPVLDEALRDPAFRSFTTVSLRDLYVVLLPRLGARTKVGAGRAGRRIMIEERDDE